MATEVFPFLVEGKKAYEDQFRSMFEHLGDGVLNDTTGAGCRLTATGTNRTVTLQPGDFKVAGFVRKSTDAVPFDASLIGDQPGVGQSRINVVVMRLDLTAKTITPTLLTGAPASSGPVRPALTNTATVKDALVWSYVDTPNATTTGVLVPGDERAWLGPQLLLADTAPLPANPVVGTVVRYADGRVWRRLPIGWVQDKRFVTLQNLAYAADTFDMVGLTTAAPNAQGDWGLNFSATFSQILHATVEPYGTDPLVHSVVDVNPAKYKWRFRFPGGGVVTTPFQVLVRVTGRGV